MTQAIYGVMRFIASPTHWQEILTPKKEMNSGKVFFLVNSKIQVNLLERNLVLLFGTNEYLRKRVVSQFPKVVKEDESTLTVKSGHAVLQFYYGAEEVIDKFVLVDVLFSDNPDKELHQIPIREWITKISYKQPVNH